MDSNAIVKKSDLLPQRPEKLAPPTWSEIGEGFETLGKVGLAMAIGFSAAGLFCRLAEQGKVRVPSLPGMVLNSALTPKPEPPNPAPT